MKTQEIQLNGKTLIPRELTVRQVETVMETLQNEEIHWLEAEFPDEPIPATAIAESVEVELDELKDILPSQLPILIQKVKEANPFLVGKVEALANIAREIQEKHSTTSADQSAE